MSTKVKPVNGLKNHEEESYFDLTDERLRRLLEKGDQGAFKNFMPAIGPSRF
jgi:hypothetical protein